MTSADRLRAALARLGLSQGAGAQLLRDAGIHASDRTMRYWCSGQAEVPEVVWAVLDDPKQAADAMTRLAQEAGDYD